MAAICVPQTVQHSTGLTDTSRLGRVTGAREISEGEPNFQILFSEGEPNFQILFSEGAPFRVETVREQLGGWSHSNSPGAERLNSIKGCLISRG
eukprot:4791909-Pyramimonas_sp.AAC.1